MTRATERQLGPRLAKLREEAGLTQERLAELIGAAPTTVSRIERGVTSPTLATIERIADALGIALTELLDTSAVDADRDEVVAALVRDLRRRSADDVHMVRELIAVVFRRRRSARTKDRRP